MYDDSSEWGSQTLDLYGRLANEDELPDGGRWEEAVAGHPGTTQALLEVVDRKKLAGAFRKRWRHGQGPANPIGLRIWQQLQPGAPSLDSLPAYSFVLDLRFRLAAGLLTKDETRLAPTENPVRKDRALGVPYIAASSWKGCLATTLARMKAPREDPRVTRMFGSDREVEQPEECRAGRLHFYPTGFDGVGYHMLHPLNRKSKTGKPIDLELVPKGKGGRFLVVYVPAEAAGVQWQTVREEMARDLHVLLAGVRRMMTEAGFGAKTSSGFGLAADALGTGSTFRWKSAEAGSKELVLSTMNGLRGVIADWKTAEGLG